MPYFMKQNVLEMSVTPCYLPVVHFRSALLTDMVKQTIYYICQIKCCADSFRLFCCIFTAFVLISVCCRYLFIYFLLPYKMAR